MLEYYFKYMKWDEEFCNNNLLQWLPWTVPFKAAFRQVQTFSRTFPDNPLVFLENIRVSPCENIAGKTLEKFTASEWLGLVGGCWMYTKTLLSAAELLSCPASCCSTQTPHNVPKMFLLSWTHLSDSDNLRCVRLNGQLQKMSQPSFPDIFQCCCLKAA